MSRFWFSPGDSTYEVRDGATILRSCDVKLLTEAEYLTERGAIAQMGRPDPNADQFARSFSQRYSQIAAQRPIYKELKSLFSFVAIARLMKDDGLSRTASRSIGYLLRGYKVPCVPVSRAVNGLTDVRTIDEAVDTPNGKTRFALIQSSCGGVSMSVRPRRIKTASRPSISTAMVPAHKPAATATTPRASSASATPPSPAVAKTPAKAPRAKVVQAKSIKKVVLGARKSAKAMSWDVPVQLD